MAYIEILSVDTTSCKVRLNGLVETYNGSQRTVYWGCSKLSTPDNFVFFESQQIKNLILYSEEFDIDGLDDSTDYIITAVVHNAEGAQIASMEPVTVTTESASATIEIQINKTSSSTRVEILNFSDNCQYVCRIYDTLLRAQNNTNPLLKIDCSSSTTNIQSYLNSLTPATYYIRVFCVTHGEFSNIETITLETISSSFLTVDYDKTTHIMTASIHFDIKFPNGYQISIIDPDGEQVGVFDYSTSQTYDFSEISYKHKVVKSGLYVIQGFVFDNYGVGVGDSRYPWSEDWGAYLSDKISISIESVRPDLFYWSSSEVEQGKIIKLTASDWNNLTDNINAVRDYRGYPHYQFTFVRGESNGYSASQSDKISARVYNEAVEAIQGIDGYGTYLSYAQANNPQYYISAYRLNALVSEINAVP